MIRNLICIASLLLASAGMAEEKKERHLFLLIGQSNMAGRAQIEEVDKEPREGAFLWNIEKGEWEPALPPYNRYSPSRKSMNMQRLNCGPSFVKAYRKAHPGVEVGIICPARGGTVIEQWEKGGGDDFRMYHHAITAAKAAAAKGGVWKGILWHQGEGNSKAPAGYPKKLAGLVENLRTDLGVKDLPFVFGQLGQWNENYAAFNEMIVKQTDAIERAACVRTDGLTAFDEAHFDSSSQRKLGERYAEAIRKLETDSPKKP